MNICIKRRYLDDDWNLDTDTLELVEFTDNEYLDEATIDEIKMFRGKVRDEHEIKTDWLYKFLHKNSVGIMTEGGDGKFIKCLRLGELDVSMQLAYRLYCLRSDRDPNCEIGKDGYEPMTEEEFTSLFPDGENSDTYVDICIWNNVTKKTYQKATQANLREIDNLLRGIVYESKMDCLV